jgi:hypothetical protein
MINQTCCLDGENILVNTIQNDEVQCAETIGLSALF